MTDDSSLKGVEHSDASTKLETQSQQEEDKGHRAVDGAAGSHQPLKDRDNNDQEEVEENPVGDMDQEKLTNIWKVQRSVSRVLRYAISQANIKVEDKFIDSIISPLRKRPGALTLEDEAVLWKGYNSLSLLIHPATNESIMIAEQIDEDQHHRTESGSMKKRSPAVKECQNQLKRVVFWLTGILLVFFILQTYVILLSDVLRSIELHQTALASLNSQIKELKTVKPEIAEDDAAINGLREKEKNLIYKVTASFDMLFILSSPWQILYTNDDTKETGSPTNNHRQRIATEQASKSVLQVLNYYFLPLILGLLGAIAFIVRKLLNSLATTSYTLNSGRRYGMRLALGALLGVMSGIFIAPDQPQLQSFNLSLVVFAFLMGYSVEFAFSIFDAIIERGRQAVSSSESSPPTKK